jgi:hypothetical protein
LPNGHRLGEYLKYGSNTTTAATSGRPGESLQRAACPTQHAHCLLERTVVEVKPDGSTAWEASTPARRARVGSKTATRSSRLVNGHRVVEYDPSGRGLAGGADAGSSAQRLENGNTLIVCMNQRRVVEVDRAGKEVWSKVNINQPYCAQRLPSGNTLVAEQNGVMEYDAKGNPVGSKLGQNGPSGVSRY